MGYVLELRSFSPIVDERTRNNVFGVILMPGESTTSPGESVLGD